VQALHGVGVLGQVQVCRGIALGGPRLVPQRHGEQANRGRPLLDVVAHELSLVFGPVRQHLAAEPPLVPRRRRPLLRHVELVGALHHPLKELPAQERQ